MDSFDGHCQNDVLIEFKREAESLRIGYSGYSGTPNTNPIQKDDDQEAMTNKAKRAMVGTN